MRFLVVPLFLLTVDCGILEFVEPPNSAADKEPSLSIISSNLKK